MKPEIIVLISALGGVIIGAIVNITTILIAKKYEYNREVKKIIAEMSVNSWKERIQLAKDAGLKIIVFPVAMDMLVNSQLFRLLGKKKVDENEVKELLEKSKSLRKLFEDYSDNVKPV